MEYCFNLFNKLAADGTAMAVDKFLRAETPGGGKARTREEKISAQRQAALPVRGEELPVVLCIGSDLAIGDSLGPIVGSMLKYKTQGLTSFYTARFPRP